MICLQILDLDSAARLMISSKKHYSMLRLSPISKHLFIKAIAREADLPFLALVKPGTDIEIHLAKML